MSSRRRSLRATVALFTASPIAAVNRRAITQLAAYVAAYIVGAFAAFGLIRLAHAPDWLTAVSIFSSLISGAVTNAIQRKLDTMSVPLGRLVAAILAGIGTVVVVTLLSYWHLQRADIDARPHISASGNLGMAPQMSALFTVTVPSHRDYLTVKFAGSLSPGDRENCINGARLSLKQNYGATTANRSTITFDSPYKVDIPADVGQFTLSATFVPQVGFETCRSDITVISARFHNRETSEK